VKLTYRGNSYEVAAPIQLDYDPTEQPKIKLVYRGNAIDYIPGLVIWESDRTDCPTVNLVYRGNNYERKLQPTPQAQSKVQGDKPSAWLRYDWRCQLVDETSISYSQLILD
jgi:hypothetical protein